MVWDLEGLIGDLLVVIACSGEKGCTVGEVVDAIQQKLAGRPKPGTGDPEGRSDNDVGDDSQIGFKAVAAIWRWLFSRHDLFLGPDRKYNNLTLTQVFAQCKSSQHAGDAVAQDDLEANITEASDQSLLLRSRNSVFPDDMRAEVLPETMWECLAGHSVDYVRLPKSEWDLLQGIASAKEKGILQGDLCRLTGQDKRSVPKRTDALVRKGYITKRTVLVRGTKTSNLWLNRFVPPFLEKKEKKQHLSTAGMNLDHAFLKANRDGVPWHDRWTGSTVDYVAFATTIVEIVKAWGIIRVMDLKLKLNVSELAWQRKTATKTFRFLHTRGILQFVGAKLNNKLFKDCLKFVREMNDSDWEVYLAVGKKGPADETGSVFVHSEADVDPALLAAHPPWTPDEPLHTYIARLTRSVGGAHLSNTDFLSLTMSTSFTRFVTTLVSAMAESTVQPPPLKHYQLRKEHVRNGKIMSFKYWVLPSISQAENQDVPSHPYGFSALPAKFGMKTDTADLSAICKPHRQVAKGTRGVNKLGTMLRTEQSENVDQSNIEPPPQQLLVTLKVSSEGMRRLTTPHSVDGQKDSNPEPASAPQDIGAAQTPEVADPSGLTETPQPATRDALREMVEAVDVGKASHTDDREPTEAKHAREEDAAPTEPAIAPKDTAELDADVDAQNVDSGSRERGRGRGGRGSRGGRGRGRGKASRGGAMNSDGKPWKCDKCGGAWKNDIGLKYHLEKARVPCNPSFNPETDLPKRGRKARLAAELRADSPPHETEPTEIESESDMVEARTSRDEDKFLKDKREGLASAIEESESTQKRQRPEPKAKKKLGCSKRVATARRFTPHPTTQTNFDAAFAMGRSALLPPMALQTTRSGSVAEAAPRTDTLGSSSRDPDAQMRSPSRIPLTPRKENGNFNGVIKRETGILLDDLEYEKPTASPVGLPAARTISQTALQRETKHRVKGMLLSLLANYDGHYPGGDSLWRTLRVLWAQEFSKENCPTNRAFKGILAALTRNKVVHEHVHAFRARNGSFANVKIISMPKEDPFAPKAREVLAHIKDNYPEPWLPYEFKQAEPQSLQVNGQVIRSKRVLPNELEELDAPVYAEENADKQRLQEIRVTDRQMRQHRAKRQKVMEITEPEDGDDMFAMYHFPNAARHTPADVQRMANFAQKTELQFLEPNTALDDSDVREMAIKLRTETKKASTKSQLFDRYGLHQQSHIVVEEDPSEAARVVPPYIISSSKLGRWPDLDGQFFESCGGSFTLHPHDWFPSQDWFTWNSIEQAIDKTASAQASRGWFRVGETNSALRRFKDRLVAAARVEIAWADAFLSAMPGAAGPHNIFLNFWGSPITVASKDKVYSWPQDTQYDLHNNPPSEDVSEISSEDSEFEDAVNIRLRRRKVYTRGGRKTKKYTRRPKEPEPVKSVELKRRHMIAVPKDFGKPASSSWDAWDTPAPSNPEELLAGIIVVRCLMGGIDRNIDWGFLAHLFPDLSLPVIRRFWLHTRKMQKSYITELTRSFQEGYITACETGELSILDFDDPEAYDWDGLIKWTMQVPSRPDTQIPNTVDELRERFTLEDVATSNEDWRERFFHFQASAYTRLELSSADPGAVSIASSRKPVDVDVNEVARSWIRSLCCTGETDYQPEDIKAKLLTLADGDTTKVQNLLQKAIAQLTADKVVHSKRAGGVFDSKPYRLMETYLSHLSRLAHWKNYKQAAGLKAQLDAAFRSDQAFSIPYVVSDGAMMALMNLNAHGRIVLKSVDLPYIPFGFTPGQYESRKLDKSLYHFHVEASPTAIYQFNEDIPALAEVRLVAPPAEGPGGALPQWVDFFGKQDMNRWLEILGAVCFAYSTRGYIPIEALRHQLRPILEDFEAKLIIEWGKRTGLLEEGVQGSVTVGEWWWLAVPIVKQHQHQPQHLF